MDELIKECPICGSPLIEDESGLYDFRCEECDEGYNVTELLETQREFGIID